MGVKLIFTFSLQTLAGTTTFSFTTGAVAFFLATETGALALTAGPAAQELGI